MCAQTLPLLPLEEIIRFSHLLHIHTFSGKKGKSLSVQQQTYNFHKRFSKTNAVAEII